MKPADRRTDSLDYSVGCPTVLPVPVGRLVVVVALANGWSRRVALERGLRIWLGRDDSCDVVLTSKQVSRRHLAIEVQEDGIWVADRSANGTLVDGAILRQGKARVSSSSQMAVGPYTVTLEDAEGAAQGPGTESSPHSRSEGGHERVSPAMRRRIHRLLLDHLDLANLDVRRSEPKEIRSDVRGALELIVGELGDELLPTVDVQRLIEELVDEALGLGPLERLLADTAVTEIMVVDSRTIFVEREGRLSRSAFDFTDDDAVRSVIERIVTPLGRRIDEASPVVDARLKDGSRVHAVIPPLAVKGPCITIRKFAPTPLTMGQLARSGALTPRMATFLERSVKARRNIVISGGTGSGKTTLLNVLSAAIPPDERIVTIEDAAELRLAQPHVVALEARPPNMEGKGEHTIRDLVKNALRMRPDRIVVGECRGGEALDMLQAMNTGHEGSMTTTHANSPKEALLRLETLCLMSGLDLPVRAVRSQIAASIHLVVQQGRFSDGSRRIVSIAEVVGMEDAGELQVREIFGFRRLGTGGNGSVHGEHLASGYLPSFLDDFVARGLVDDGDYL